MTDKELIQVLRCENWDCWNCNLYNECCTQIADVVAADRLEALLAENEHLREVTKMMPQWVSVSELPKEPGRYLCRVKSVVRPGRFYANILEYDKGGFWVAGIYVSDVTHWMPLPSAEGGWSE